MNHRPVVYKVHHFIKTLEIAYYDTRQCGDTSLALSHQLLPKSVTGEGKLCKAVSRI